MDTKALNELATAINNQIDIDEHFTYPNYGKLEYYKHNSKVCAFEVDTNTTTEEVMEAINGRN